MTTTLTPPTNVVTPKVGDILLSTFGYDALIAKFAMVTRVSGKSVFIRELARVDNYMRGGMSWTSFPSFGNFVGAEERKIVKLRGDTYSLKDGEYSTYYFWGTEENPGRVIECYNHH